MGQSQIVKPPPQLQPLTSIQSKPKTSITQPYLIIRDPRLIQNYLFQPQLFSGQIDAEVKRIQRLIQFMPMHILQIELIDNLNDRFSRFSKIKVPVTNYIKITTEKYDKGGTSLMRQNTPNNGNKKQNVNQSKNNLIKNQRNKNNNKLQLEQPSFASRYDKQFRKQKSQKFDNFDKSDKYQASQQLHIQQYTELQTQQKFMDLIRKFQHQFYIQKQLNKGIKEQKTEKRITVRKKIIPNYQSQLDRLLFSKLYLKSYIKIMKLNFGGRDRSRNILVTQFHNSIGKMICDLIQRNHFNLDKLIQLSYKIIYLQKSNSTSILQSILEEIRTQFWPFYLTKEHNLTLKPQEYGRIRQIARCFLDELYLRSLKEAEDPDIVNDTNEGFGILKNFPICRIREDKHR